MLVSLRHPVSPCNCLVFVEDVAFGLGHMLLILFSDVLLRLFFFFFFSSRRRHTRCSRDWSSDVCSSDLRSPTTGDRSVVTIEGAWGLGSAVVGGEVTPDRWVLGKVTGEISVREISDKLIQHVPAANGGIEAVAVSEERRRAPCLSDTQLQELGALARQVERHYGRAQDIEWAIDRHSGAILLLQSRPETVWSARDAAPIAKPQQDPLM